MGNAFRGDDGVGVYLASLLGSMPSVQLLNAGQTPENIVDEVVRLAPKRMIFLDAAQFGAAAGEVRVIPISRIEERTLSTHQIPLSVVARLIEDSIPTQDFLYWEFKRKPWP